MTENILSNAQEASSYEGHVAEQQYLGIKKLYQGIVEMTKPEQRQKIAGNYNWVNHDGTFLRERRYGFNLKNYYNYWLTTFNPNNAFDFADHFFISESSLVRDVLFFHEELEDFNNQIENFTNDSEAPISIDERTIADAIETKLKYEVMGPENFVRELIGEGAMGKQDIIVRDSHGKWVYKNDEPESQDPRFKGHKFYGEHLFLHIMDDLDKSLKILAQDERTQPLYYKAINDLAERTSKKLRQLGKDKTIASAASILAVIPAIPVVAGEIKALNMEAKNPKGTTVNSIISMGSILPRPLRSIPNVSFNDTKGNLDVYQTDKGVYKGIFTSLTGNRTETFDLPEKQFIDLLDKQFHLQPKH